MCIRNWYCKLDWNYKGNGFQDYKFNVHIKVMFTNNNRIQKLSRMDISLCQTAIGTN